MTPDERAEERLLVRLRILTIAYFLLLAGVVFLAGRRGTDYLLSFVGVIPFGDKIGHFVLMGALSLLVNLSLRACSVSFWGARYLLGSSVVGAIVLLEEISQIFIRSRTFDWLDLLSDFAGILIFGEAARFLWRRLRSDFAVEQR